MWTFDTQAALVSAKGAPGYSFTVVPGVQGELYTQAKGRHAGFQVPQFLLFSSSKSIVDFVRMSCVKPADQMIPMKAMHYGHAFKEQAMRWEA